MVKVDILSEIRELFISQGNEAYFGEEVSQFQHAAQALVLAKNQGEDLEMQTAAFLHDIGHLLTDPTKQNSSKYGRKDHEWAASEWLRKRKFSERIIKSVENHVAAKKYLCYKEPDYFHELSDASKATLLFQGGVMTESEAEAFEKKTYFREMIALRKWDDQAKEVDFETPTLDECLDIIEKYFIQKS
jgi:2-amino-1-hydroxyethylphosphonate dioxygenase (glycine-forming)